MPGLTAVTPRPAATSWIDRALSPFADVRAGEGATALLLLANVFVLLVCYSIIKTVREPLILLGGGAEVRSYAAAGQALLLMGLVPAYCWFASRVNRTRLLLGVSLFFLACIELFALAVTIRLPLVGVAFFIWVGIFNMSLVAQFWSFASDLYAKEAGARLFPIIMMGMTGGAPLGSFIAGRLFRLGFAPGIILQIAAVLLSISAVLYVVIDRRESARAVAPDAPLAASGGFGLVLRSGYLRLVAALVILLNIVNTTGEYLVARRLSEHVTALAAADPGFNRQAFIGAFSGDYQFWVNVSAFILQAFVTSRLVKSRGLAGALLALPLIALGGYAVIAAGAGFSLVRWAKTAENAVDYSIMNTARQMLWLPTSREEKYKAKQAIDTFFVRGGDVLSAGVVFAGTAVLHLSVQQFATVNLALIAAWLAVAVALTRPRPVVRLALPRAAALAAAVVVWLCVAAPAVARAQAVAVASAVEPTADSISSRAAEHAAAQQAKAAQLHPFEAAPLEQALARVNRVISSEKPLYMFMGGPMQGAGLALGPGYRARYGDTGRFDAHATWSLRSYKELEAVLQLPALARGRATVAIRGNGFDAPAVAAYGIGNQTTRDDRTTFSYRSVSAGATGLFKAARHVTVGAAIDSLGIAIESPLAAGATGVLSPSYRRTAVSAELDTRPARGYSRRGRLLRAEVSDYAQTNGRDHGFRRIDAEVQQLVPIWNESSTFAFRASASMTNVGSGQSVPYALLPDLGGNQSLRGYAPWRFRDRHRLILTGEYRWMAGPLIDMALFVDAGKVAARRADLTLDGLHVTPGIGVRLHTPASTITRLEVARSRDGLRLVFAFTPSF